MNTKLFHRLAPSLALGAATLFAACSDNATEPHRPAPPTTPVQFTTLPTTDTDGAIATLQRVTARYHNIKAAFDDDFILLHPCEDRPGEGPVGAVYINMDRLLDGQINPELPDALIYEPHRDGLKLVGVEFAIPKAMWTAQTLPQFLGATFQTEDEFGVYALHAWVWRTNPDGLFAETNPRVSCGEE